MGQEADIYYVSPDEITVHSEKTGIALLESYEKKGIEKDCYYVFKYFPVEEKYQGYLRYIKCSVSLDIIKYYPSGKDYEFWMKFYSQRKQTNFLENIFDQLIQYPDLKGYQICLPTCMEHLIVNLDQLDYKYLSQLDEIYELPLKHAHEYIKYLKGGQIDFDKVWCQKRAIATVAQLRKDDITFDKLEADPFDWEEINNSNLIYCNHDSYQNCYRLAIALEHQVPVFINEKEINKYPFSYSIVTIQENCLICFLEESDCVTSCNHHFHKSCIGDLEICPYCSQDIRLINQYVKIIDFCH
jgi:hypothetical protein